MKFSLKYFFSDNLRNVFLERVKKAAFFYKKLKQENEELRKFREEEDSDYIEPYLLDLTFDLFMFIVERVFLFNKILLQFESFRAYVDNMQNSVSSKSYAKCIALVFNLIIYGALIFYMFPYWCGELVFVVFAFVKRYLVYIPSIIIIFCALITVLIRPIYSFSALTFFCVLLLIQFPVFRGTIKEGGGKFRTRIYFLFILFFDFVSIVFLDYFFLFFDRMAAGDLFSLFFNSVDFLEFVYDWPFLYEFWNFIFFVYMQVWSWAVFWWSFIAYVFDFMLFALFPKLFLGILSILFKILLPCFLLFLFFYYVVFLYQIFKYQRVIRQNFFIYATLRLFIGEDEGSKYRFFYEYCYWDFIIFFFNFFVRLLLVIFERIFLFLCTICGVTEVLWLYSKKGLIYSWSNLRLDRYVGVHVSNLMSSDELRFALEERKDLRVSYIFSYLNFSQLLHPQLRLDYILSSLSYYQNGYRFFFGLDNEKKFYLQKQFAVPQRVLNFRWVDSLNYKFQYSFLTVSWLSLIYFFVGPFFFFSLPDNEVAEHVADKCKMESFTRFNLQLGNMRLFFSNLNLFLNFILKKDLEQILLENEIFENWIGSASVRNTVIPSGDKALLDHTKRIMSFYTEFNVQFNDVLTSYVKSVRGTQNTLNSEQQVKLKYFERRIDTIKDDLTFKYLFQDIHVPRAFFNRFVGNPIAEKNSTFSFLMPLKAITIFEKTPIELYNDFYDYNSLTDFYKTELKKKVSLNNFACEVLEMDDISVKLDDLKETFLLSQKDFIFTVSRLSDSILFSLDEINLLILNFETLQDVAKQSCKMSDVFKIKCVEFVAKLYTVQSVYQNYLLRLTSVLKRYSEDKNFGGGVYSTVLVLRNLVRFYEETVIPTFVFDQYVARSIYSASETVSLKKFAEIQRSNSKYTDLYGQYDTILAQLPTIWSLAKSSTRLLLENLQYETDLSSDLFINKVGFSGSKIGFEPKKQVDSKMVDDETLSINKIYKYLNLSNLEWDNNSTEDDSAFENIDFQSSQVFDQFTEDDSADANEQIKFRYNFVYNGKGFFYKSRNRHDLQWSINKTFFETTGQTFYFWSEFSVAVQNEQYFQNGLFQLTQSWDTSMLRRIRRDLITIIARSPEGFLAYISKSEILDKQKLTHDFFLTSEVFLDFLAYLEACALRLVDRHYLDHLYTLGKAFDQVRLEYLEDTLDEFLELSEGYKYRLKYLAHRHSTINNTFFVEDPDAEKNSYSILEGDFLVDPSFDSYVELATDLMPYIEDKFESTELFKLEYNLTDKKIVAELRDFRGYYKEFRRMFLEKLTGVAQMHTISIDLEEITSDLSVLEQFRFVAAVLFKRKLYFFIINVYLSNYFKYYNRVFFLEKYFKDERDVELPRKYYVGPAFRSAPLLTTRVYESSIGVWEDDSRFSDGFADNKLDFFVKRDKTNSLVERGFTSHKGYTAVERFRLFMGGFFDSLANMKFEWFGVSYYLVDGLISFLLFFFFFPLKWLYEDLSLAVSDLDQFLDDIDEDDGIVENWMDNRDDTFSNLEFDLNNSFDSEVQDDDSLYNTVQASVDLGVDDESALDAKYYSSLGVNGAYYDFESRYIERPGHVSPFVSANSEQSFEHWFFFFEWRDFLITLFQRLCYIVFLNKVSLILCNSIWFIFLLIVVPYCLLLLLYCLIVRLCVSILKFLLFNIFIYPLVTLNVFFFQWLSRLCELFVIRRLLEIIVCVNMLPLLIGYRITDFFTGLLSSFKVLTFGFNWFIFKSAYVFLVKRFLRNFFRFLLFFFKLFFFISLKVFLVYFYFIICFQYYDVIRDGFETVFFMKLDFRDFFLLYMMGVFLVIVFVVGPLNRLGCAIWELRYDYLWSLVVLWVMMYFVNNIDYLTMHYWHLLDSKMHIYGPKYFETFWEHQVGFRNVAKGTKSIMALPLHSKLLLTFKPEWYNFHLKRFKKYLTHKDDLNIMSEISIMHSAREFFYYHNWAARGLIKESDYNYVKYHNIHNLEKVQYMSYSLLNYYDMLYSGFKPDPLHYIGLTGHRTHSWFRDHSDMQRLTGDFLNPGERTHPYAIKFKRYNPKKAMRRVGLENGVCKRVYLKYYQDVNMKMEDLSRTNDLYNTKSVVYTKVIQDFWYGRRFNQHERFFYWKSRVARVHLTPLLHGYMYVPDFIFFGAEGWGIDLDMLEYDYVNNTTNLDRRRIFRGKIIKERFSVSRNYRNLFEALFFGPPV